MSRTSSLVPNKRSQVARGQTRGLLVRTELRVSRSLFDRIVVKAKARGIGFSPMVAEILEHTLAPERIDDADQERRYLRSGMV